MTSVTAQLMTLLINCNKEQNISFQKVIIVPANLDRQGLFGDLPLLQTPALCLPEV